jgi:DNA-binding transcriptional MocR family regulator
MPVNSFDDHPLSWTPDRGALAAGPAYLAIAAALEGDIRSGRLAPGARIPPQRELADFLDLDFTTVTRAYGVCREKGLVYGVTGRGTFVSSAPAGEGGGDVADCGVVQAFPEVGADEVLASARDVVARASSAGLFSYGGRDGSPLSRSAGVAWLRRTGVDVGPSQMAVFPGAQGAMSAALLSLFRVGDAVAVDEFTYGNFLSLARLAHLRLVPVESDGAGMVPAALAETASKTRLRGVFLMPHCANPTAFTLSERRKDDLAGVIRRNDLLLVEDDASLALPKRREKTMFARLPERTAYISGTTRYIAGGLRATFMAYPEGLAGAVLGALHHLTIKAGALDAEILADVVLSGRAERILRAKAEKARAANSVFDETFPSAPRADPTSPFRMLPLPGTAGRGPEIERRIREAGVAVFHSDRFSVRPGNQKAFLRVSLSSVPSLSRLRRALEALVGAKTFFAGALDRGRKLR